MNNFKRNIDPKSTLKIGYRGIWESISKGDIFEIIKALPNLGYHKSYVILIISNDIQYNTESDYELRGGTIRFEHESYTSIEELKTGKKTVMNSSHWTMGFEFFKEHFKKIN